MPVFATFDYSFDFCGNSETIGPLKYVEADSLREVEELMEQKIIKGNMAEEIEVETIPWIHIQHQLKGQRNV